MIWFIIILFTKIFQKPVFGILRATGLLIKTYLQTVDLKQIDCQLFFQQRWVYSESAENCKSESAKNSKSHASLHMVREGELFYRGEEGYGRATVSKEPTAFHWLCPCQERSLSSSCWILLSQGVRAPPSGPQLLFIEASLFCKTKRHLPERPEKERPGYLLIWNPKGYEGANSKHQVPCFIDLCFIALCR